MTEQVGGVARRVGKTRTERELAELEALASDQAATDLDRAVAATKLAHRRGGHLPRHLVPVRRAAFVALQDAGMRPVEIARAVGLAPYGGRVCQILREAREGGGHVASA